MVWQHRVFIAAVIVALLLSTSLSSVTLAGSAPPPATAAEAEAAFRRVMAGLQVSEQELALAIAWVTPAA
jgi:hypothetical protein